MGSNSKEYNSKYYHANRERLLQRAREKSECDICKKPVAHANRKIHEKGKYHNMIVELNKLKEEKNQE